MYCPYCGVEIPNSSVFCGFCGKKMPTAESAEPVTEAVEKAVEAVAEPVSEAAEKATEVTAEQVTEAVEKAAEVVAEPVSEAVEKAAEVVAEPVSEAVEKAAEIVAEPVSEAVEKAVEAAEPVSEEVERAVEAATEPVFEAVEKAVEAAEPVSEEVEKAVEAAEPVSEEVEKAVEAAAEPVSEEVERAVEAAEPVSEEVEKAVEAAAEPVSEEVEKAVEAAAEPVSEAVEKAVEAVAEPVSNTSESADASVLKPVFNTVESVDPSVPEPVFNAAESSAAGAELAAGNVTYSQPEDAAFGEISDSKETKARRAFSITALLKNKLFLICAAAFLVFVILIIVVISAAVGSSDKNPLKGFYYSVYADGETVFLYNGSVVKGTDFSRNCNIEAISEDGTAALVIDGETLTLLSGGKVDEITDDLSMGNAALSANGKTVVYVSDGELTAYSGGKKSKITDLDDNSYCDYVISPDGGTVVFAEYNSSYSVKSVSAWNGKKVTDLDAKFKPVAVSNGGKIVYGIKNSSDLVYLKNLKAGSDEKIREISGIVETTADNSGIIFSSSSSTYYFDSSTSEAIKVSGRTISVLDNGGYPKSHDNFKHFYAVSGNNGVYNFTKKGNEFDSEKIISGASRVKLSADGKTFVYKDDDELIKVSVSNTDKENVIGDEVYSYNADPTLKYIYYLDEDGDLRFASSKKTKIASDVKWYTVNYDGVCVFCDDEGDLYYSSKGGERKKASISDVEQITLINGIVYVKADDTLYVSENGKSFKKTGVEF